MIAVPAVPRPHTTSYSLSRTTMRSLSSSPLSVGTLSFHAPSGFGLVIVTVPPCALASPNWGAARSRQVSTPLSRSPPGDVHWPSAMLWNRASCFSLSIRLMDVGWRVRARVRHTMRLGPCSATSTHAYQFKLGSFPCGGSGRSLWFKRLCSGRLGGHAVQICCLVCCPSGSSRGGCARLGPSSIAHRKWRTLPQIYIGP